MSIKFLKEVASCRIYERDCSRKAVKKEKKNSIKKIFQKVLSKKKIHPAKKYLINSFSLQSSINRNSRDSVSSTDANYGSSDEMEEKIKKKRKNKKKILKIFKDLTCQNAANQVY